MKRRSEMKFAGLVAVVLCAGAFLSEAAVLACDGFDIAGEGGSSGGIYKKGRALGKSPNNEVSGGRIIGFGQSAPWESASGVIQVEENGSFGGSAVSKRTKSTSALRLARNLSSSMDGRQVVYASARLRMDLKYKGKYKAQAFVGFSKGPMQSTAGAGVGMMWNLKTAQWDLVARYNNGKAVFAPVKKGLESGDTGSIFVVWKMDAQKDRLEVWIDPADVTDVRKPAAASFPDYKGSVSQIEDVCFYSRWLNGTSRKDGVGFYFDELTLGENPEDVMP